MFNIYPPNKKISGNPSRPLLRSRKMEPMEDVFKAESEARGKKNREYILVLSYCKLILETVKIDDKARKQMIETINEVLKDD